MILGVLRRYLLLLFDWEWSFGVITTSNVRRLTYHTLYRSVSALPLALRMNNSHSVSEIRSQASGARIAARGPWALSVTIAVAIEF